MFGSCCFSSALVLLYGILSWETTFQSTFWHIRWFNHILHINVFSFWEEVVLQVEIYLPFFQRKATFSNFSFCSFVCVSVHKSPSETGSTSRKEGGTLFPFKVDPFWQGKRKCYWHFFYKVAHLRTPDWLEIFFSIPTRWLKWHKLNQRL